jgi:hypothetical protein
MTPDPLTQERNWLAQEAYLGDAAHGLGCPTAWDTTLGSPNVYVCVVSSVGVALAHPDIAKDPNTNLGFVLSTGLSGPLLGSPTAGETAAANAYGTAVAGVAAANWSGTGALAGNGQVIGVAPNASIFSLRTPDINPSSLASALEQIVAETFATASSVPPAIPAPASPGGGPVFLAASYPTRRHVALLPVPTVLPGPPNNVWTPAQISALTAAIDAGVVVVVATGHDVANAGSPIQDDVAERSDVIVVGANAISGVNVTAVDFSRTGPSVCLTARGAGVVVADLVGTAGLNTSAGSPGNNAASNFNDITAAAAAQAAGVAALVLSANSRLRPLDVRRILRESCEGSAAPHSPSLGFGQLRADLAVAKAVQRRADVAVQGSLLPLECNFGDVEAGSQLDRVIELRLGVPGSLSPVTYSVGTLPANISAISGGGFENPGALIVVDGAPKLLKLRVTAPASTGLVTATLQIDSDDDRISGTAASFSITVKYNVVPLRVVDSVLVLDRSGSMSGAAGSGTLKKVDVVIDAAKLYADMLRNGDRLGVVSFDHLTEVLLSGAGGTGLVVAGDPATTTMRAHLKARLTSGAADLGPRGATSIGGGVLAGDTLLDSQTPAASTTRVLFVFTDGLHNTAPDVGEGLAQIPIKPNASWEDTRVFAVRAGLGSNTASDGFFEGLTSVANGGWAANVDSDLFMVQKLFLRVIAEASDFSLPVDPEYLLAPGQSASTTIPIGDVDSEANFIVLYKSSPAFPKYLRVWLEEPSGAIHQFQDVVSGGVPGIAAIFDDGHVILRCKFPLNAAVPRGHVGLWKVWVENALQIVEIKDRRRVGNDESLSCAVTATVKSNLRLAGRLTQPAYTPGSPITVTLEPTSYGLPLELATPPEVRVARPDGVALSVPVTRTAQGSYVGTVTDTGLLGSYQFAATVRAQTPGALLSRDWAGTGMIRPVAPLVPTPAQDAAAARAESVVRLPDSPGGGGHGHGHGHGHDGEPRHPDGKRCCWHAQHCCGCCNSHPGHGCCHSLRHKLATLLKL